MIILCVVDWTSTDSVHSDFFFQFKFVYVSDVSIHMHTHNDM